VKDLRQGDQRIVAVDDLAGVVHGLLEQTAPLGGRSQTTVG
jgi:hypothetical protein